MTSGKQRWQQIAAGSAALAAVAAFWVILGWGTVGPVGPFPEISAYSFAGCVVIALIPVVWLVRCRVTLGWPELRFLFIAGFLIGIGGGFSRYAHGTLGLALIFGAILCDAVPYLTKRNRRTRLTL